MKQLFVRGLGLVFAIAFISLGLQVAGLIGPRGMLPATELLAHAAGLPSRVLALRLPTWLWLTGASDAALQGMCVAGVVCAALVFVARWARVALLAAWSLYLSLCTVGDVFLSYQWDALLLECGVVGFFVGMPGSRWGLVLARALCLKLMLLSGMVKLLSGDPYWRDLSALYYHFWTQPLPAWPAVLMSELPRFVLSAMTFATLAIELVAPLAIFGPRRARLAACAALALLQVMIAATGNYGFFNLLALLLCATLLDDAALFTLMPARLRSALAQQAPAAPRAAGMTDQRGTRDAPVTARRRASWAVQHALVAVLLGASAIVGLGSVLPLPRALTGLVEPLRRLQAVNSYGLFAVMTTERREIALEGSRDGKTWRRYGFRYKPGPVDRRPRFIGPHMPRLDWQMWFAGLGRCEQQQWLLLFFQRVLQGEPAVLSLLAYDPFPGRAPRYLRTPSASYRFAPPSGWLHGQWWVREPLPDYCPPVTLRDGQLALARELTGR